jgi:hypothetical protein
VTNENSLKNLRPWQPGVSGNPNGRPTARSRLTERFIADISDTWAEHGAAILKRMAVKEGTRFADLCSRLIPRDVQLTLQQRLPGGLEPDDWQSMLELLSAIKSQLPDDKRQPGEIAQLVGEALRLHNAKVVEACAPVANALPNIDKSSDS